ncbi:hypothetical protein [Pseudooceanicola algae]|uniref:Cation/multidrug efflux pump n=1 Tax=Pseudooceanicola algae TaxID=1537215 RepID=A0A418SAR1_9RHOB|nr:hypothetical protein [Pseudooceanicola algae]QPM91222.1 hypothetical protein PSAL_024730 [Pseudooceanicola algae]
MATRDMSAFLRLGLILFLLMTVAYVVVSLWSRRQRRRRLEREWEEEGLPGKREDYVHAGLQDYDDSFRRKLILLIYIVPLAIVGFIIYAVNYM